MNIEAYWQVWPCYEGKNTHKNIISVGQKTTTQKPLFQFSVITQLIHVINKKLFITIKQMCGLKCVFMENVYNLRRLDIVACNSILHFGKRKGM